MRSSSGNTNVRLTETGADGYPRRRADRRAGSMSKATLDFTITDDEITAANLQYAQRRVSSRPLSGIG